MTLTTTDLEVTRGDDIRIHLIVKRNNVVVNITGATFVLTCKRWLSDTTYLIRTEDYEILDADEGEVVITIPSADSETFTDTIELNYDVQMVELTGLKTTVARGKIKFYMDVSDE